MEEQVRVTPENLPASLPDNLYERLRVQYNISFFEELFDKPEIGDNDPIWVLLGQEIFSKVEYTPQIVVRDKNDFKFWYKEIFIKLKNLSFLGNENLISQKIPLLLKLYTNSLIGMQNDCDGHLDKLLSVLSYGQKMNIEKEIERGFTNLQGGVHDYKLIEVYSMQEKKQFFRDDELACQLKKCPLWYIIVRGDESLFLEFVALMEVQRGEWDNAELCIKQIPQRVSKDKSFAVVLACLNALPEKDKKTKGLLWKYIDKFFVEMKSRDDLQMIYARNCIYYNAYEVLKRFFVEFSSIFRNEKELLIFSMAASECNCEEMIYDLLNEKDNRDIAQQAKKKWSEKLSSSGWCLSVLSCEYAVAHRNLKLFNFLLDKFNFQLGSYLGGILPEAEKKSFSRKKQKKRAKQKTLNISRTALDIDFYINLALDYNAVEILKFLVEKCGVNIKSCTTEEGGNILHQLFEMSGAFFRDCLPMTEYLVRQKIDLNKADNYFYSVLDSALANHMKIDILLFLIRHGACFNVFDPAEENLSLVDLAQFMAGYAKTLSDSDKEKIKKASQALGGSARILENICLQNRQKKLNERQLFDLLCTDNFLEIIKAIDFNKEVVMLSYDILKKYLYFIFNPKRIDDKKPKEIALIVQSLLKNHACYWYGLDNGESIVDFVFSQDKNRWGFVQKVFEDFLKAKDKVQSNNLKVIGKTYSENTVFFQDKYLMSEEVILALFKYAVSEDSFKDVEQLFRMKADVRLSLKCPERFLIWHWIAEYKAIKIIFYEFQKFDSLINQCDEFGRTPLHTAFSKNQASSPEKIFWEKFLKIFSGEMISARDKSGKNILHYFAQTEVLNYKSRYKILEKFLLQHGVDMQTLNVLNHDGFSPLHLAVINPRLPEEIIVYMAKKCLPSLDLRDNDGNTALILALQQKRYDLALKLIELGADVFVKNQPGENILSIFLKQEKIKNAAFESLNNKIIELIEKDSENQFFEGNISTRAELFVRLLQAEEPMKNWLFALLCPNLAVWQDNASLNALLHAFVQQDFSKPYIKKLCVNIIQLGADIHAKNAKGDTALALAIKNNNENMAKLLINHCADIVPKKIIDAYDFIWKEASIKTLKNIMKKYLASDEADLEALQCKINQCDPQRKQNLIDALKEVQKIFHAPETQYIEEENAHEKTSGAQEEIVAKKSKIKTRPDFAQLSASCVGLFFKEEKATQQYVHGLIKLSDDNVYMLENVRWENPPVIAIFEELLLSQVDKKEQDTARSLLQRTRWKACRANEDEGVKFFDPDHTLTIMFKHQDKEICLGNFKVIAEIKKTGYAERFACVKFFGVILPVLWLKHGYHEDSGHNQKMVHLQSDLLPKVLQERLLQHPEILQRLEAAVSLKSGYKKTG